MMRNVEVMSILGHKSTACKAVKNYTNLLLYVPKTLFTTWFQFQVKVIKLPVVVVFAILKLAPWGNTSVDEQVIKDASTTPTVNHSQKSDGLIQDIGSDSDPKMPSAYSENDFEPRSEDIVRNVKRLRNCTALSITQFTGNHLFWDLPILSQKVKTFSEAFVEGNEVQIEEAKEALKQYPVEASKPKSKTEYHRVVEEATENYEHSAVETVPKTIYENFDPVDDRTECKSLIDNETENRCKVSRKSDKKVCFHLDDEKLSKQNRILKKKLSKSYDKLDEVLRSCNTILEEVTRLNDQFSRLTAVSSKISILQYELERVKLILETVEEERNEMQQKLFDLSQLIKEEEEYLDDVSCESGFEEVENVFNSYKEEAVSDRYEGLTVRIHVPNEDENVSDSPDELEIPKKV